MITCPALTIRETPVPRRPSSQERYILAAAYTMLKAGVGMLIVTTVVAITTFL